MGPLTADGSRIVTSAGDDVAFMWEAITSVELLGEAQTISNVGAGLWRWECRLLQDAQGA